MGNLTLEKKVLLIYYTNGLLMLPDWTLAQFYTNEYDLLLATEAVFPLKTTFVGTMY